MKDLFVNIESVFKFNKISSRLFRQEQHYLEVLTLKRRIQNADKVTFYNSYEPVFSHMQKMERYK